MADEFAWLVEQADPNHPNHVTGNFLAIVGLYDGHYGSGEFQWTRNANDAIRFARQKDAAMFIGAISALQENLPHRDTIRGLCSGSGPRAIAVEHKWSDPNP